VIRAKAVSAKEVDSGNDIYGNPIKRIQYEIKQIKVRGHVGAGDGGTGQPPRQPLTPALAPQMFKGPDKDIEFIYTAPSTAVCGRLLDTGGKKEYLIAGGCPRGRALGGRRVPPATPVTCVPAPQARGSPPHHQPLVDPLAASWPCSAARAVAGAVGDELLPGVLWGQRVAGGAGCSGPEPQHPETTSGAGGPSERRCLASPQGSQRATARCTSRSVTWSPPGTR